MITITIRKISTGDDRAKGSRLLLQKMLEKKKKKKNLRTITRHTCPIATTNVNIKTLCCKCVCDYKLRNLENEPKLLISYRFSE